MEGQPKRRWGGGGGQSSPPIDSTQAGPALHSRFHLDVSCYGFLQLSLLKTSTLPFGNVQIEPTFHLTPTPHPFVACLPMTRTWEFGGSVQQPQECICWGVSVLPVGVVIMCCRQVWHPQEDILPTMILGRWIMHSARLEGPCNFPVQFSGLPPRAGRGVPPSPWASCKEACTPYTMRRAAKQSKEQPNTPQIDCGLNPTMLSASFGEKS